MLICTLPNLSRCVIRLNFVPIVKTSCSFVPSHKLYCKAVAAANCWENGCSADLILASESNAYFYNCKIGAVFCFNVGINHTYCNVIAAVYRLIDVNVFRPHKQVMADVLNFLGQMIVLHIVA